MLNQDFLSCFLAHTREDMYICTKKSTNMTKDEFILQVVIAQMHSILHVDTTVERVLYNAHEMADACEKEHLFDQESTNDILVDIRNLISDETCN